MMFLTNSFSTYNVLNDFQKFSIAFKWQRTKKANVCYTASGSTEHRNHRSYTGILDLTTPKDTLYPSRILFGYHIRYFIVFPSRDLRELLQRINSI